MTGVAEGRPDLILFEGDSMTSGDYVAPGDRYTTKIHAYVSGNYDIRNLAVSGNIWGNLVGRLPTTGVTIPPLYPGKKIAVVMAGSNDIVYPVTDQSAAAYANAAFYLQQLKSYGYTHVIYMNMLPRESGSKEAWRQKYNTMVMKDFTRVTNLPRVFAAKSGVTYADYMIDLSGDPAIGDPGDEWTANFIDGIHPSGAGNTIIASYLGPLLNGILNDTVTVHTEPNEIPGLVAWFEADSLDLAENDPIATLADLSGNGHTLTQPTAGKQGAFHTRRLNGRPGINLPGYNYWMSSAAFAQSAAGTLVTTYLPGQKPQYGSGRIFEVGANQHLVHCFTGGGGNNVQVQWGVNVTPAAAEFTADVPFLAESWGDGSGSGLAFNGVEAAGVGAVSMDTSAQSLYLNRWGGAEDYLGYGHFFMCALYNRALTSGERAALRARNSAKYALGL